MLMKRMKPVGARGRAAVKRLGRNYKTGGFAKIAARASKRYGSSSIGKKVAGAVYWAKVRKKNQKQAVCEAACFLCYAGGMDLLTLIIVILIVAWLGGFALHIGGDLIHILLVIAIIVVIYRLITTRRLW
jgi:uncharacterized membrane protein YqjE